MAFLGAVGARVRDFYTSLNAPRGLTWMDNLVACNPPDYRPPRPDEIAACRPRIIETINLVDPDLILTMGKEAITALTGRRDPIETLRGKFYRATIPGRYAEYEIPVFSTLHPGQFLHNPDPSPNGIEALWERDFRKAVEVVVTLKQARERTK